jgi:hypothetical protein
MQLSWEVCLPFYYPPLVTTQAASVWFLTSYLNMVVNPRALLLNIHVIEITISLSWSLAHSHIFLSKLIKTYSDYHVAYCHRWCMSSLSLSLSLSLSKVIPQVKSCGMWYMYVKQRWNCLSLEIGALWWLLWCTSVKPPIFNKRLFNSFSLECYLR